MPKYQTVTENSKPSIELVEKWYAAKTKVTLHESAMFFGKRSEKKAEGIIRNYTIIGANDAVLFLEGNAYGMYVRNIISYTAEVTILTPPESKVVLSQEEAHEHSSEAITLIAGEYSVYVSKPLLAKYCEYFTAMFQSGMNESYSDSIDLSNTITANGLQLVVSMLDKYHKKESTYFIASSLDDAFELIINADLFCSQTLMNLAFEKLSSRLREYEVRPQLRMLLENPPVEMHPLIRNLLLNTSEWVKHYQGGFPSYIIGDYQAMVKMPKVLMHMSLMEYESKMLRYSVQLEALTQVKWFFNGLNLCSERITRHHPDNPKHRDIYAHVVTDILIRRGILSAEKCEFNDNNPNMRERWSCHVTQESLLFSLDANQIRQEIQEASRLIQEITGYNCNYLQLYPLPETDTIRVLAEIGCIAVKEYYAFNVKVNDYNIQLLRLLKNESITLKVLCSKYQSLDKSKPLLDQIIPPERQEFLLKQTAPKACVLTQWNKNTSDATKQNETYCGFKRGFLIGKRF